MARIPIALAVVALASLRSAALAADAGPTHHSGKLDSNEVWLPSGNPHILDDDVYTQDSVTLTIARGCTVLVSAGVELYTGYAGSGSIVAVGTPDSMIVIKSLSDTTPGSWRSVSFYENTMPTARLGYVTIEHAGGGSRPGAVYVRSCIAMEHCLVRKSATCGVYCTYLGRFSDFSNNTITGSGSYPVWVGAECVRTLVAGNTMTGNARDEVLVDGGTAETSGTWLNHGVSYGIYYDVAIQDATNLPVVTIAPGTALKLYAGVELYVGYGAPGGLIADGTDGQITFTSAITPPAPGDWAGLSFYPNSIDSLCQLENCRIEYGGARYGDIYINDCTPTITGDSIGHSLHYGIYLVGTQYPDPAELRANNAIYDYVDGDINIPDGIDAGPVQVPGRRLAATIVRSLPQGAVAFDAMGRGVLNPRSGVFFVLERSAVSGKPSAVTKVVMTR